jgi:formamidopyrimidine-DNA glycosylase
MPELPEVESLRRRFMKRLRGRKLSGFTSRCAHKASPSPRRIDAGVRGRTVLSLDRRGKHLLLRLDDGGTLTLHLGMSGRLEWGSEGLAEPAFLRAWLCLEGGERLWFCDARKFGRIALIPPGAPVCPGLGVEPLSPAFTVGELTRLLRRRRRIKPLLLDQQGIAGLGNIYTDEALHRARISPFRRAHTLTVGEIRALYRAIRRVLLEAIRNNGTSFDWIYPGGRMQSHLRVYGRQGLPCRRCGVCVAYRRLAQRGTHWCPGCQR